MTFADQTVREFIEDVASGTATPGGGSVAAIAGAAGAALCEMVCNLTIGKDDYADVEDELSEIESELSTHRERLLELADEDSAAFDEVMAAFKTPAEEGRAEAIEEASKLATEVPLETAENCLAVVEGAVTVTEKGSESSVTDGGTAGLLAHAALQAALYNVEINLASIDDESYVEDIASRAEEIEADAAAALEQVTQNVETNL
jgi:formiminotetrahydrofolate cyclodeaminase